MADTPCPPDHRRTGKPVRSKVLPLPVQFDLRNRSYYTRLLRSGDIHRRIAGHLRYKRALCLLVQNMPSLDEQPDAPSTFTSNRPAAWKLYSQYSVAARRRWLESKEGRYGRIMSPAKKTNEEKRVKGWCRSLLPIPIGARSPRYRQYCVEMYMREGVGLGADLVDALEDSESDDDEIPDEMLEIPSLNSNSSIEFDSDFELGKESKTAEEVGGEKKVKAIQKLLSKLSCKTSVSTEGKSRIPVPTSPPPPLPSRPSLKASQRAQSMKLEKKPLRPLRPTKQSFAKLPNGHDKSHNAKDPCSQSQDRKVQAYAPTRLQYTPGTSTSKPRNDTDSSNTSSATSPPTTMTNTTTSNEATSDSESELAKLRKECSARLDLVAQEAAMEARAQIRRERGAAADYQPEILQLGRTEKAKQKSRMKASKNDYDSRTKMKKANSTESASKEQSRAHNPATPRPTFKPSIPVIVHDSSASSSSLPPSSIPKRQSSIHPHRFSYPGSQPRTRLPLRHANSPRRTLSLPDPPNSSSSIPRSVDSTSLSSAQKPPKPHTKPDDGENRQEP